MVVIRMGNIQNVKRVAAANGVSLSFLCKKINKSRSYLSEIASRDADVPDAQLSIIANALNVPFEELSGRARIKTSDSQGTVFAKNINVILAERGISKSQFYADINITAGAFYQWMNGLANPSPETLQRIADYLGVTPATLTAPKEKPTAQGDGLSEKQQDAIKLVQSMSDDDLDRMIETLKIWTAKK